MDPKGQYLPTNLSNWSWIFTIKTRLQIFLEKLHITDQSTLEVKSVREGTLVVFVMPKRKCKYVHT